MARRIALAALVLASVTSAWLLSTDDARVWPVRNTLQYHVMRWWQAATGSPGTQGLNGGALGSIRGRVRDAQGFPLSGIHVLLTRWDGTTYGTRTGRAGDYRIDGVPAGSYALVTGEAAGGGNAKWLRIVEQQDMRADVRLMRERHVARVAPAQNVEVGDAERVRVDAPLPGEALRRTVRFSSGGRPSQPVLYYTPIGLTAPAPVLLAVYPGPADGWGAASVPLAAAGYAVIAAGPAYSFELERDVDELARLLQLAGDGRLPGADARRTAVLGGSYSALHVQRLMQREHNAQGSDAGIGASGSASGARSRSSSGSVALKAAVLMWAPSDLFDMRRRLENGTYVPPFGLDQALIALGFPDREPVRHWRYSGAYHVHSGMPPVLLVHSRQDDVVPYQQSELLARLLSDASVPHELRLLDGGSHYLLSNEADARAVRDLTLTFLRRYVG